ncbi:MAG: mechanosensitive ion channel family protein [Nitrospirae bacterium]|nr:MAG: mechanosensitive ion channel family protein [Nitrospirota bacterium]
MFGKPLYGNVTLVHILIALGVGLLSMVLSKVITLNIRRRFKDRLDRSKLSLITKAVSYGLYTLALLVILPLVGFNLSGLAVAGGITGLIVGFASQKVVSNLISGVFLMVERPVKVGQQINVEGVAGVVEDISIISTIIRTYDGLYIRVPNEKVFTSNITNYVANVVRRFEYTVGIRYSDDAEKAIEIIKGLIEAEPFALKNPEPQVFVDSLGDNSVNIVVRVWAPATDWYPLKMALLWKIKTALEASGIEIPFPQRVLWFASPLKGQIQKAED